MDPVVIEDLASDLPAPVEGEPKRQTAQERIDEITKTSKEMERRLQQENAFWRTQAELNQRAAPPKEEPAAPVDLKPAKDDFEDQDDYIEALTDWKAKKAAKEVADERDAVRSSEDSSNRQVNVWKEREAKVRETIPDYDTTMATSGVQVRQSVIDAFMDSEYGPQIAHHLATHPEVAAKLSNMGAKAIDREIGRLEVMFEKPVDPPKDEGADDTPALPVSKTSKAPAPTSTIKQSGSTKTPLEKMGMDEYIATRKSQKARWVRP